MKKSILLLVVCAMVGCRQQGFSDEDIRQTEESIRTEFNKKPGVRVTNVQMMRGESPRKLMGIVNLSFNMFGEHMEATKSCSATMGENNQYMWRCE